MNCGHVEQHNLIERYLEGTLAEAEREEFEQHYFECEECFAQMEAANAARKVLQEIGPAKGRSSARPWMWAAAAIAAALVIAVLARRGATESAQQVQPPSPEQQPLIALNEIQPP